MPIIVHMVNEIDSYLTCTNYIAQNEVEKKKKLPKEYYKDDDDEY